MIRDLRVRITPGCEKPPPRSVDWPPRPHPESEFPGSHRPPLPLTGSAPQFRNRPVSRSSPGGVPVGGSGRRSRPESRFPAPVPGIVPPGAEGQLEEIPPGAGVGSADIGQNHAAIAGGCSVSHGRAPEPAWHTPLGHPPFRQHTPKANRPPLDDPIYRHEESVPAQYAKAQSCSLSPGCANPRQDRGCGRVLRGALAIPAPRMWVRFGDYEWRCRCGSRLVLDSCLVRRVRGVGVGLVQVVHPGR